MGNEWWSVRQLSERQHSVSDAVSEVEAVCEAVGRMLGS